MLTPRGHTVATFLAAAGLLLTPVALWAEKNDQPLWNRRLLIPHLEPVIDRHTPIHFTGTLLPATIAEDTTLSPADNPVIITGPTTLAANHTLTIQPGTQLYIHEFGSLTIAGTLHAEGETNEPIVFTSNEAHPANQTWNGIILTSRSQATITNTSITHAAPGITCEAASQATLSQLLITTPALGLYNDATECSFTNSRIRSLQHGLAINEAAPLDRDTLTIHAQEQDILFLPPRTPS